MFRSTTIRRSLAFVCLGAAFGCATAQQPDLGIGEGTSSGGSDAQAGSGGTGNVSTGGKPSNAGGTLGASGSVGTSGSHAGGGTGSAGVSSSAGSSSGGTSSGAAGASAGGSSSAGTHAGGTSSSAGNTGAAGAGIAGTTGSSGNTGVAGTAGTAGGGASGTVLFSDDFEDGATDKWVTSGGTWSVVTDGSKAYAQTQTGSGSTVLLSAAGSTTWTDQVIEARVKVTAFGGQSTSYFAAIYGRYNGTDYYSLLLRSDGKLVIRKDKTSLSNAVDAGITEGIWYTVRLEIVGSSLKGYLNGTLEATATDSTLTSGGIAVSTVSTTAEFDEVKVTLP